MKIVYQEKKFSKGSLAIIDRANAILDEYTQQGYSLTLRQLYYQFVARGLLANRQTEYKRLGSIINDARMAGLVDWYLIEDRTRFLRSAASWKDGGQIVRACASSFHFNRWENQPYAFEVWIEKDALVGVVERICTELDLPYFACRGYASQSEAWRAGRRLARKARDGKNVVVLHLGDHDPSGIDMTRDNDDRLNLFSGGNVEVRRLALNMDQVEQYGPPPNPAKLTDSRAIDYIGRFGNESWELDALEPSVINELIRDAVEPHIEWEEWRETEEREGAVKAKLQRIADDWIE